MTRKVAVFMATGFEEMELTITVDILRRAEIEVKTVSLGTDLSPVTGSRGIKMLPDQTLADIDLASLDMIVLPGGLEGTKNLGENKQVLELVKEAHQTGKIVAAICAAPAVLVRAGIAVDRELTSHPAAASHMQGVKYSEQRVVKDGKIITSRAAGTTFEFAFALMRELFDPETVEKVNAGVLARI